MPFFFYIKKSIIAKIKGPTMIDKYLKLNDEQKTLVWLLAIGAVVFVGLCPLFFFYHSKGYSYPLGWLLGTVAEIIGFWTIMKMGQALLPKEGQERDAKKIILFVAIRFAVYVIALVLAGICTFKPEWFGGWAAFNFFATFAGLLPAQIIVLVRSLKTKKGLKA